MDIKDAENQLDKADSFLTKLWKFLGKHWGKLIILLLIYGGYKFCVLVSEGMDKPQVDSAEQVQNESIPEEVKPYVVRSYEEIGKNGNTLTILVWSDSVETVQDPEK
jgi:hypothetical protein